MDAMESSALRASTIRSTGRVASAAAAAGVAAVDAAAAVAPSASAGVCSMCWVSLKTHSDMMLTSYITREREKIGTCACVCVCVCACVCVCVYLKGYLNGFNLNLSGFTACV